MLQDILFVFWFFGPAGLANMAAFFSGKIPFLKPFTYPVDLFLKFRRRRVLGSHKTVRGFVVGIFFAIVCVYLERFLYQQFSFVRNVIPLDYSTINPFILGFLSGFGALAGDAIKSFFKRQAGIQPGKSWVPFDQIDYILGGMIFTALYIKLTIIQYLWLFFLWFLIHPLTSFAGYLLRLKKEPL